MQNLYAFPQVQLLAFALVLVRLSAFVVVWPVFSVNNVPQHVKVLFALVVTIVIFPLVGWKQIATDVQGNQLMWMIVRETFLGASIGYITRFFFFAVSAGGEMISVGMGLSNASLLNPAMNSNSTAIEQLKVILATLIFLALNGHHIFLQGLVTSYQVIPLSTKGVAFLNAQYVSDVLQAVTIAGLKLSAPVMVSVLLLNITMGIVGRAVPQINVLVMSMPITILGGLMVLLICLPLFYQQLGFLLNQMAEQMFATIKMW